MTSGLDGRNLRQTGARMQPLIYDVAVSIDGYIGGPDGDISQFAQDGAVVDDYTARLGLETCATAIMGRATRRSPCRTIAMPARSTRSAAARPALSAYVAGDLRRRAPVRGAH